MVDNKNYQVVDKDGVEAFKCNICGNEAKTVKACKQHITRDHIKKPKTPESDAGLLVDDDKDDPFLEGEADGLFERYGVNEDLSLDESTEDVTDDPEDDDIEKEPVMNLDQALERIKTLEEDVGIKEDLLKNIETELAASKEMATVAMGTAESLRVDNETSKVEVKKFKLLAKKQMNEINRINAGADPEMAYKLKAAQDEVKAKVKALELSEKARKELVKKLEEEVTARAKAEADATRLSKVVDTLQKIPNTETVRDKSKIKCRDVGKPGGCRRAGSCHFLHPALANKKADCDFWVAGECKYSEQDCRYKHDPKKRGTDKTKKKRRESDENSPHPSRRQEEIIIQSEPRAHPSSRQEAAAIQPEARAQPATQDQDFILGLVRAFAPSLTTEARQGREDQSPRQRNVRQRMDSQEDWQERRGRQGTFSKGMERQKSPARGSYSWAASPRRMEDDFVEKMREWVQPAREVRRPEDSLTEAARMILQAVQAGRR